MMVPRWPEEPPPPPPPGWRDAVFAVVALLVLAALFGVALWFNGP